MNMKKYYVVLAGRTHGIFYTWKETNKQVSGYPRAKYKGYRTLGEAQEAWKRKKINYKKTDKENPMVKRRFHAVFIGRISAVVSSKALAEALTKNYPDGCYGSFFSKEAAYIALEQFLGINDSDLLNSNQ